MTLCQEERNGTCITSWKWWTIWMNLSASKLTHYSSETRLTDIVESLCKIGERIVNRSTFCSWHFSFNWRAANTTKTAPQNFVPPNKSKEKFGPRPPPPEHTHTHIQRKKCITVNYGRVQLSECFYVNLRIKLAHPAEVQQKMSSFISPSSMSLITKLMRNLELVFLVARIDFAFCFVHIFRLWLIVDLVRRLWAFDWCASCGKTSFFSSIVLLL